MAFRHPDQAPKARAEGSLLRQARSLDFASLRSGRRLVPVVGLALVCSTAVAFAANGIDVSRGADRVEFGNCVPSLTVENRSAETIDYLQVDLVMALSSGQQRVVELKSAYREGVLFPIAPGGKAVLKQHLDTSLPLGVPCGEVKARTVARTICEAQGGKACASSVSVKP